jgi:anaerobic selenocysteine-containing dehydrogenase
VKIKSICRCCTAGCGIVAEVSGDQLISVRGDTEHPVSHGYICPKGHALPWSHDRPDRLDYPLISGRRVAWPEMLDDLAGKLRGLIDGYGGSCIGRYEGTGTATDTLGKRALGAFLNGVGSTQFYSAVTIDIAPAFRISQLVAGSHKLQPQWLPEDPDSSLVLWIGSNPAVSHAYTSYLPDPVRRIRAFRNRGGKLWVIDPRATKTASIADHHLPIRPGTDYILLAWLVHEIMDAGRLSEAFFECTTEAQRIRLRKVLAPYVLHFVADATGLVQADLESLREAVIRSGRLAIVTGTGVNFQQHALITEWLRWIVLLATDSLDQKGGMWFNPGWLEAFDLLDEPLPLFAEALERAQSRPDLPRMMDELPVAAMPDEIRAGNLRALFVNVGNPMTAFPDPGTTTEVLGKLGLLVVADVARSATAEIATHVLPVTGQMERMDLMSSRTAYAAVAPPVVSRRSERRPMWWVCGQLALRLGLDVLDGAHPDEVTEADLMRGVLAEGRKDLGDLLAAGSHGIKLPEAWGYMRERVLPNGTWNILPAILLDRLEHLDPSPTEPRSFLFVNGRQLSRNCSTQFVPPERSRDRPVASLNPADAAALCLEDGALVRIVGEDGQVIISVQSDSTISPGVICATQGWTDHNVSVLCSLTRHIDPLTGQPAMTALPVQLKQLRSPDTVDR